MVAPTGDHGTETGYNPASGGTLHHHTSQFYFLQEFGGHVDQFFADGGMIDKKPRMRLFYEILPAVR